MGNNTTRNVTDKEGNMEKGNVGHSDNSVESVSAQSSRVVARPLKFQAWNGSEMEPCGVVNGKAVAADGDVIWEWHQQPEAIWQFTGLKDKNGVEIYDGDIVRILYTDWGSQHLGTDEQKAMTLEEYKDSISDIGTVVWRGSGWCLEFDARFGKVTGSLNPGKHGQRTVIGNIYENASLLQAEQPSPTADTKAEAQNAHQESELNDRG